MIKPKSAKSTGRVPQRRQAFQFRLKPLGNAVQKNYQNPTRGQKNPQYFRPWIRIIEQNEKAVGEQLPYETVQDGHGVKLQQYTGVHGVGETRRIFSTKTYTSLSHRQNEGVSMRNGSGRSNERLQSTHCVSTNPSIHKSGDVCGRV